MPLAPAPGLVVLDGYRLTSPLGEGTSGSVWLASAPDGVEVAVKLLPAEGEAFARQEVAALEGLAPHPGVVSLQAHGAWGDGYAVVLAHVPGVPLGDRLRGGPVPLHLALGWVAEAAEGLAHLHREGVVHRDVKAANLLLRPDGSVVWIDLGLAVAPGTQGAGEGSVHTMPPEQIAEDPVGPSADIYSLGALLYRLVAGRYPYHDANPVVVLARHGQAPVPPLPASLRLPAPVAAVLPGLLRRMLAKAPGERPGADEVAATLRSLVPHAVPSSGPWHLVALAAALIVLVSIAGWLFA